MPRCKAVVALFAVLAFAVGAANSTATPTRAPGRGVALSCSAMFPHYGCGGATYALAHQLFENQLALATPVLYNGSLNVPLTGHVFDANAPAGNAWVIATNGTIGYSLDPNVTIVGLVNVNLSQIGGTTMPANGMPTLSLVDSNASPRPAIFADNPANATCNTSVAFVRCQLTVADATPHPIIAQPGTGLYTYITGMSIYNSSGTNVGVQLIGASATNCTSSATTLGTWAAGPSGSDPPDVSPFNPVVTATTNRFVCVQLTGAVSSVYVTLSYQASALTP